ncbi:hypothetical protein D1007_01612 [Hordeum vulgare]|nr:hypothetical protein D1007_01612 [Hordeum vulgare]
MAAATTDGDDVVCGYGDLPGLGPDDHVGLAMDDGGSSSYHSYSDDEDLEEEAMLSMEDRVKLAEIWVANTTTSHQWTSGAGGGVVEEQLAAILYQPVVLYDLNEPAVLAVDLEDVVFHSSATQPTVVCTQQSINFRKDKLKVVMEEEPMFEQAHNSSDESEDAYDSENNPFCTEKYMISEDAEIIEGNNLAEEEDVDRDEDSYEEQLHYEGDTEVEDLFEMEEEEQDVNVFAREEPSMQKPSKKRKKLEVRKGPLIVIKGEKTFAIKKMRLEHTCLTNTKKSRISAKWLAKTYESLFRSDPTTSIHTLIDRCREKYGVDVARHLAYRDKNLAVEVVLGEHKKQYPRLRDYAHTIMDTNPGSRVVVTTFTPKPTTKIPHPGPRFHAMFFCINGAREGFLNGCKPFIGGETGKFGPYTIMSDRQKGLLNAVNQVFLNCHQRFFLIHLYANFQIAGFRGEDLKKCMDNANYAYNQHKFNIAMNDLKNESEEAWKWRSGIPKHTWARHAFDTNCKTYLVVNNLSEVFNNYILDFRKKTY